MAALRRGAWSNLRGKEEIREGFQEEVTEPVLNEMRELTKSASGGERHSRQGDKHKQRHREKKSMACMGLEHDWWPANLWLN